MGCGTTTALLNGSTPKPRGRRTHPGASAIHPVITVRDQSGEKPGQPDSVGQ